MSQAAYLYTVYVFTLWLCIYSGGILSPYFVKFTSCLFLHSVCIYSVALYFQWRNPITLFCRQSDSRPTSCPHPPSSWHGQTRLWDWTRWYQITGSTPYDTGSNLTAPRKTAGQWLYVSHTGSTSSSVVSDQPAPSEKFHTGFKKQFIILFNSDRCLAY